MQMKRHVSAVSLSHVSMPYAVSTKEVLCSHVSWMAFTPVLFLAWNVNCIEIVLPDMADLKSAVSMCFVKPSASIVFVSHHFTLVVEPSGTFSLIIGSPYSSPTSRQMICRRPHKSMARRLSCTSPPEHWTRWSRRDLQSVTAWTVIASLDSVCHEVVLGSCGVFKPCKTILKCSASS